MERTEIHAEPDASPAADWHPVDARSRAELEARPVVFLGPSLPLDEARKILDADFRPPIRRGDLDGLPPGAVVGIIDGVFDQNLAISPAEVLGATRGGVLVFGSSSMGALRSAEVRDVVPMGRIAQMFRDEVIEDDDEVALVFDPDNHRPLSEPLVNVRYAIERLVSPGTIDRLLGDRLLAAAKRLFYPERSWRRIVADAGVADRQLAQRLAGMLAMYDLKREDAVTLLEHLAQRPRQRTAAAGAPAPTRYGHRYDDHFATVTAEARMSADAPLLFWEYGDRLSFAALVRFLKLTGRFEAHAGRAVLRYLLDGGEIEPEPDEGLTAEIDERIVWQRFQWGWYTAEEARVTLRDLGLGAEDLVERVGEEARARRTLMRLAREQPEDLLRALRGELFLEDLALKREALRLGSLQALAAHGAARGGVPRPRELRAAEARLCEELDAVAWPAALEQLADWGVSAAEAGEFVREYALARRGAVAVAVADARSARRPTRGKAPPGLRLVARPKQRGDRRFCTSLARAHALTKPLRKVVGITRVSMITGLGALGIPNAQAFRPDGKWSSTIGSGKSESVLGAKVGAVMEEVEKWAQEQYPRADVAEPELVASYRRLRRRRGVEVLDPSTLDLPYDSSWHEDVEIGWRRCHDLLVNRPVLVPSAALIHTRVPNDPFYSVRLGQKTFSTNGLASGFTLEEALTHAICEVIERHSNKLADLLLHNPGVPGHDYRFIDPATVPASTRRLVRKVMAAGEQLRLLDITSEIGVPTFWANILVGGEPARMRHFGLAYRPCLGFATHPDPEVALNMALLEASQTLITNVAGAREDLAIKARSLGRHERTRATSRVGLAWMRDKRDPPLRPFSAVRGFVSRDARADVRWLLERLRAAGVHRLPVVDYTLPELGPARVVRVIAPGLETINPFHTGLRARRALVRDLLPQP
jgi:ribosomal protein S12 methylthiotransferase accessory factor